LNEFARVRRLEIDKAVAVLIALRRTLIFGVGLTDLLLGCRLRYRRSDCRRAECEWGLPWRLQSPLSQWVYLQHGFSIDMSLFGPRG